MLSTDPADTYKASIPYPSDEEFDETNIESPERNYTGIPRESLDRFSNENDRPTSLIHNNSISISQNPVSSSQNLINTLPNNPSGASTLPPVSFKPDRPWSTLHTYKNKLVVPPRSSPLRKRHPSSPRALSKVKPLIFSKSPEDDVSREKLLERVNITLDTAARESSPIRRSSPLQLKSEREPSERMSTDSEESFKDLDLNNMQHPTSTPSKVRDDGLKGRVILGELNQYEQKVQDENAYYEQDPENDPAAQQQRFSRPSLPVSPITVEQRFPGSILRTTVEQRSILPILRPTTLEQRPKLLILRHIGEELSVGSLRGFHTPRFFKGRDGSHEPNQTEAIHEPLEQVPHHSGNHDVYITKGSDEPYSRELLIQDRSSRKLLIHEPYVIENKHNLKIGREDIYSGTAYPNVPYGPYSEKVNNFSEDLIKSKITFEADKSFYEPSPAKEVSSTAHARFDEPSLDVYETRVEDRYGRESSKHDNPYETDYKSYTPEAFRREYSQSDKAQTTYNKREPSTYGALEGKSYRDSVRQSKSDEHHSISFTETNASHIPTTITSQTTSDFNNISSEFSSENWLKLNKVVLLKIARDDAINSQVLQQVLGCKSKLELTERYDFLVSYNKQKAKKTKPKRKPNGVSKPQKRNRKVV